MKCFYHNDLDGRCAGAIVSNYERNCSPDNFFEVDYTQSLPIDKIENGEKVYLVDYSFKQDTVWQLEEILKKTNNVVWCDHHTSSIRLLEQKPELKNIKGIISDKMSGACLIYLYLYQCKENEIPKFIQYVSDYDCWIYKYNPATTFFKIGIETKKYDALDSVWLDLFYDEGEMLEKLLDKGEVIKGYIDQDNDEYRKSFAYESEIDGYRCLVVNRKSNSWIFGEKYNEYPLVMVWVFNGEKYVYSIYSGDPNVDCSKIAEKFHGGGHKGAAGFTSDELLFKRYA